MSKSNHIMITHKEYLALIDVAESVKAMVGGLDPGLDYESMNAQKAIKRIDKRNGLDVGVNNSVHCNINDMRE